jgi:putative peptidoglycan lipid II flippase
MGISFVFSAVNQKNNYFLPMALTGIFYNLSIIFGILFLHPIFGIKGIIFGVILGALLYFLLQLPTIFQEKIFPKKVLFFNRKEIMDILKISVPRSIALLVSGLVLIFLIFEATFLKGGSVTILNFSLNIFLVPISVVAIAYSVASFPKLAKLFFEEKKEDFKKQSRDIISRILFFGIPISLFFIFFSVDLVGLLLGSERFGIEDIKLTAFLVSILSLAIVFQAISTMTVRIFYAMGKT